MILLFTALCLLNPPATDDSIHALPTALPAGHATIAFTSGPDSPAGSKKIEGEVTITNPNNFDLDIPTSYVLLSFKNGGQQPLQAGLTAKPNSPGIYTFSRSVPVVGDWACIPMLRQKKPSTTNWFWVNGAVVDVSVQ
jgi:hypothetical protein